MNKVATIFTAVLMILMCVPAFIMTADCSMDIENKLHYTYRDFDTLIAAHERTLAKSELRFTCDELRTVLTTVDKVFFTKWKQNEQMFLPNGAISDENITSFPYVLGKFKSMECCRKSAEMFVLRSPHNEIDYELEHELAHLRNALQLDRVLLQMYLYQMDKHIAQLCNSYNELYASFKNVFVEALNTQFKNYETLSTFFKFRFAGCEESKDDIRKNQFIFLATASPFHNDSCYTKTGFDEHSCGTRYMDRRYERIFDFYCLYLSWLRKCSWYFVQYDNFILRREGDTNNFEYLIQKDPFYCKNMIVTDSGMYRNGYYYRPPEVLLQYTVKMGPVIHDFFQNDDPYLSNIVALYFTICRNNACQTKEEAERYYSAALLLRIKNENSQPV